MAARARVTDLRRQFDWLLADASPNAVLWRSLWIIIAATLVTAYFSELFFFPDEHYQVLEFMSYKLGTTQAADLPWEYRAHIRSWFQPFLYYLIATPLMVAGVRDLFQIAFILRLATGILSLTALVAFAKLQTSDLEPEDAKLSYAYALRFFGFLPYLFVRTSSETVCCAVFSLGLVAGVRAARTQSARDIILSGIYCGLAFEFRYQAVILVLGLFLWLVSQLRARAILLVPFVFAASLPVVVALPIDHWGYGVWCFPPWTYLDTDLFQGLSARASGSYPFFAYLYLLLPNIFLPMALGLVVSMIVTWLRNPRHYVTWTSAPFVIVHSLISHKEERFLFPLAILATSFPVLAFSPSSDRAFAFFGKLWRYRRSVVVKFIAWSSVAAMAFLAVYPFGIRPHMPMAKYLYRHFADNGPLYSFDQSPFASYPMYRPSKFKVRELRSAGELKALLRTAPVYLMSETPTLPNELIPRGVRISLVYSEFPLARFGHADLGTRLMCEFAALRQETPIAPPRLAFMTLFQVQGGGQASDNAYRSSCTPAWNVRN